jgi:hypothetical protein
MNGHAAMVGRLASYIHRDGMRPCSISRIENYGNAPMHPGLSSEHTLPASNQQRCIFAQKGRLQRTCPYATCRHWPCAQLCFSPFHVLMHPPGATLVRSLANSNGDRREILSVSSQMIRSFTTGKERQRARP